jgi:hypothetical protein
MTVGPAGLLGVPTVGVTVIGSNVAEPDALHPEVATPTEADPLKPALQVTVALVPDPPMLPAPAGEIDQV